jgi:hypothetical protein
MALYKARVNTNECTDCTTMREMSVWLRVSQPLPFLQLTLDA